MDVEKRHEEERSRLMSLLRMEEIMKELKARGHAIRPEKHEQIIDELHHMALSDYEWKCLGEILVHVFGKTN